MEILTKKINGFNYQFNCKTYENYYNWGHKVQFIVNNRIVSEYKITYYNRTWESFQYQTCMRGAINDYYNIQFNFYLMDYKNINGITRLTKEKKEDLQKQFNKKDDIKSLLKLKKIINGNGHELKRQYINEGF